VFDVSGAIAFSRRAALARGHGGKTAAIVLWVIALTARQRGRPRDWAAGVILLR